MKRLIVYIHGKGGNAHEADHYKELLKNYEVIGFDYKAQTPWEAKEEFSEYFAPLFEKYDSVSIIANSIGAFFAMNGLSEKNLEGAFFISPIVDMEKLITDMMTWANVSYKDLEERKSIKTGFGETLSWDYLRYVKEHPTVWRTPSYILYGQRDNLVSRKTVSRFAEENGATLAVMKNGEHWFHTDEQINFLDENLKIFFR